MKGRKSRISRAPQNWQLSHARSADKTNFSNTRPNALRLARAIRPSLLVSAPSRGLGQKQNPQHRQLTRAPRAAPSTPRRLTEVGHEHPNSRTCGGTECPKKSGNPPRNAERFQRLLCEFPNLAVWWRFGSVGRRLGGRWPDS